MKIFLFLWICGPIYTKFGVIVLRDMVNMLWFDFFHLWFFYCIAQSCEDLNKQELDYQCEWRYNSCGPACPITCQHPQPLECRLQCVEGCHVHCPAGKSIFCFKQLLNFFCYAPGSIFFLTPPKCSYCMKRGCRVQKYSQICTAGDCKRLRCSS